MSTRVKISVVLGAIIAATLVVFYLFNGNVPSTPTVQPPAPTAKPMASAAIVPNSPRPITLTPPPAKSQIEPPRLTPAQVAAFKQPLSVAAQNSPAPIDPPSPEETKAITNNLRQLGNAAQSYMMEQSRLSASYDDLVGDGTENYLHHLNPVVGEDYTGIIISNGESQVTISTPDGTVITYSM
jgi:hypothetical protein